MDKWKAAWKRLILPAKWIEENRVVGVREENKMDLRYKERRQW
jgi:hypothetical protein